MTKILLLNSDSPSNKGDQLILKGNIILIKRFWPDAEIWACSQYPDRDSEWFGINFLPMPVFSLNPSKLLKLSLFARRCDYVFWGGGEFLKDYTNRISVIYWFFRILSVRILNSKIYGLFQGIGPTKSPISKKLIAATVSLTRSFFLRDKESYQKLIDWGVEESKLYTGFDPALMVDNDDTALVNEFVNDRFSSNVIGVSLRRWFHYDKGRFLPYHWRGEEKQERAELSKYKETMAALLDDIIERTGRKVLFFPMFNSRSEGDDIFCDEVKSLMNRSDSTFLLESDNIPPNVYINLASKCDAFLTTRLHASILATIAGVPATNLYYVDKGRLFFEQIGQEEFSFPIEFSLEDNAVSILRKSVVRSIDNAAKIRQKNKLAIRVIRSEMFDKFKDGMDANVQESPD